MNSFKQYLNETYLNKRKYTKKETKEIGDKIGIDWNKFDSEEFYKGIHVELEHNTKDPKTNAAKTILDVGRVALAHLEEIPDYYTRLLKMEEEAKKESSSK